ncbi:uncharacterized protein [Onthophagus taurus]|uniref:uncharacterized protein n=1 Tax=Onthophagus taurus TaxID=166361 RepID=UPI000C209DEE|nr:uncharacterized protein LOC111420363 [Onthophagus taurus]
MFWFSFVLISFLITKGYLFSDYRERCNNNDECIDHRLICNNSVCDCDKYHKWIENECVQVVNTSFIMENEMDLLERKDLEIIIGNYNEKLFKIQSLAGLFVAGVCFLAVILVMIYCCYVRNQDNKLKRALKIAKCKHNKKEEIV